jgi:hypothetical protein
MDWARYSLNGYECSSAGDQRFSALFAKLNDGRTIEEAYQLDVKGYRATTSRWQDGKGKPALNGKSRRELWAEYLGLWQTYISENQVLLTELRASAAGKTLTDKFSTSDINQARALATIINDAEVIERLPFSF